MPNQSRNPIGQNVGNYRLTRHLGGGTFAEVYLGQHIAIEDRQVAIKILTTLTTFSNEDLRMRQAYFFQEAKIIARLKHPNIIRLVDFGVIGRTLFLIMDYMPNGTLFDLHPRGHAVPLDTVVSWVKQIAEPLQYAHNNKIIHRDLKPKNILLGEENELVLSDFGIAIPAHNLHSLAPQRVAGSFAYTAPEQFLGQALLASDQYSLGIIVYEWLCGELPFTEGDMGYQHNHVSPPLLRSKIPSLSPLVEQVVMKALEKKPENRFPTVKAFAEALEQALVSHIPPTIPKTPVIPTLSPPIVPNPLSTALSSPYLPQSSVITQTSPAGSTISVSTGGTQPAPPLLKPPINTPPRVPPAAPGSAGQPSWNPENPRQPMSERFHRWAVFSLVAILILGGSVGIYRLSIGSWLPTSPGSGSTWMSVNDSCYAFPYKPDTSSNDLKSITWSGTRFVAVGANSTILTSSDGSTWTTQDPIEFPDLLASNSSGTRNFADIIWSGTRFVVVGELGTILTSSDGKTWTSQNANTIDNLYGVAWSGALFVAVGEHDTILTSPDGKAWTLQYTVSQNQDADGYLYGVAWSGTLFVAVGKHDTILTSPDGKTWTLQHTVSQNQDAIYSRVVWSGTQFVTVGDGILTSRDGETWISQAVPTWQFLEGVVWSGTLFVAVGDEGTILTSPDGKIWSFQHISSSSLTAVAWSGTRFVTVGFSCSIYKSV